MQPAPSPMPTPDLAGLLRRAPGMVPASASIAEAPDQQQKPTLRSQPVSLSPQARQRPATSVSNPAVQQSIETTPTQTHSQSQGRGRRQYLRSITLYLPRSVHRRLKAAALEQDTTSTALILSAVNATHQYVGEALKSRSIASKGSAEAGPALFEIPQARRPNEPAVETTIRVTDAQLGAIKDLAARYETNRSQLIAAALRLHLIGGRSAHHSPESG